MLWTSGIVTRVIITQLVFRGSASVMSPTPFLTEVRSGGSYEPPTTPPTKEYWEKNAEVSSCRVCFQVNFGMVSHTLKR